jgi:PknH-like extracellular domain
MRQLAVVLALASACILVAACSNGTSSTPTATGKAGGATTTSSAAPVAAADLPGLLLSEAEINAALGATGIAVLPPGPLDTPSDNSSQVTNKDCLVMVGPAQTSVYTGSGYVAAHQQSFQDDPDIAKAKYLVNEAVVSFPSATHATSFLSASAKSWPACSNLAFEVQEKAVKSTWSVGPVSNTNGTLSATRTQEGLGGWACQRALTVRNNVAVDVVSCAFGPEDTGVKIAQQIAAKVPK